MKFKLGLFINKAHYNPHDPDSRISVKPGKARKLKYHCSIAVHSQGGISHIQADFADGRDSQYLPKVSIQLTNPLEKNELVITDLRADTGDSIGSNYRLQEKRNITG